VGLFVCLEPPHCHGGSEKPAGGPGDGPGELRAVLPVRVVGSHRELGRGRPPPPGQGRLDGLAVVEEVGEVPDRHVSLCRPWY
jgi:hypothetical protein